MSKTNGYLSAFATSLVCLAVLSGCAPRSLMSAGSTGAPLELYAQLTDIGALARACDGREPDAVTRDWVNRYAQRELAVLERLTSMYGESAVEAAQQISVHGCFGGASQAYREHYETVLTRLEARVGL